MKNQKGYKYIIIENTKKYTSIYYNNGIIHASTRA